MPRRARPNPTPVANAAAALVAVLILAAAASADRVPNAPATDPLAQQLAATPARFASWDNPALYALLQQNNLPDIPVDTDADAWPPPVDWQALAAGPADFRGQAFRIDARFLAAETVTLNRPSIAHDQPVQQWAVQFADTDDDVAIVILPARTEGFTAPPPDHETTRRIPLRYARVAIPARFLGHWETRDRDDQPFAFPVFIANDAAVYDQPAATTNAPAALFAAIAILAAVALALWWRLRAKPWTPRTRQRAQA
ncbi:MAG: hypothetical protein AAF078_10325, partial [Planctomycetota bacterium]